MQDESALDDLLLKYKSTSLIQRYLGIAGNKLLGLPDTKRMLYHIIEEKLSDGYAFNLAIGGLRKIGKTTILKQLAQAESNRLYLSMQYIKDIGERNVLLEELITLVQGRKVSALLLDEICKLDYYDDFMQVLINCASAYGVPVIFTSSSRYYLRQITFTTLGGRCRYVDLHQLSYYEYLTFQPEFEGDFVYTQTYSLKNYIKDIPKFKHFNASESTFKEYLDYCSNNHYLQEVGDYIESCYAELLESDCGYTVKTANVSGNVNIDITKKLLYVLQYKMLTEFKNNQSFIESATQYKRERFNISKVTKLRNTDYSKLETTLHEYLQELRKCDSTDLLESLKLLLATRLLNILVEKTEDISFDTIYSNVERILGGYLNKKEVSNIFTFKGIVSDINIYLSILKDFLSLAGLNGNVSDYLAGSLLGEVVEYYVTSQIMIVSGNRYSIKFRESGEFASEIDIVDTKHRNLIEVGIGNKSSSQLAFCNPSFIIKHPEYLDYTKVYVSSRDLSDRINEEVPFIEISYYNFGLYTDAMLFGKYIQEIL